jgi:hypothetical protein
MPMSELAYDLNGEPITLPASAQWWRVRRFRNPGMRGAPEVVTDRDGAPLVLPIDTAFTDFREEVDGASGRYRLDPLDERRKVVPDVPAAYVTLSEMTRAPVSNGNEDRDAVVRELVRAQADMVKSMSERFASVMHAAAELLRAADGAGLPARPPLVIAAAEDESEDDDEEDDEVEEPARAPAGLDINALVAQIVPVVATSLMNGKLDLSKLASLLDWRKAAASAKPAAPAATATAVPKPESTPAPTAPEMPPLDPAAMAHFIAIQSALTPEEAAIAREVAKDLSPAELRAWFAELAGLSVPDAVAKIRSIIGAPKSGGVS